ncbi:MAG: heavy metal translocating P-type ATPase [Brevinema sp.]
MVESRVFWVSGMHCTACSSRLEKKLNNQSGVQASVNFASSTAVISFDSSKISADTLNKEAEKLGFKLKPETKMASMRSEIMPDIINLAISWVLSLILIMEMFGVGMHTPWYSFGLATISVIITGRGILRSAWSSFTSGVLGMDVLIALGALVALGSSFFRVIGVNMPNYAMTASMLISVNLLGRFLETIARGRASQAVQALAKFNVKTALKRTADGSSVEVLVQDLQIGDVVDVRAGDRIPADGVILEGHSTTDESFLTGESLPVEKKPEDKVYAGSINIEGALAVRVNNTSEQSFLAQTVSLMQEAQGTKIPIQIMADKITAVFVPIIVSIAVFGTAIWIAFPNAIPSMMSIIGINFEPQGRFIDAISVGISVLVIACPCALGLATPMALVNGSALGAKNGILIRRGAAVQLLSEAAIIALDKTGTITEGQPELSSFHTEGIEEQEALSILAGLEQLSSHPLASCINQYAIEKKISAAKVENVVIKAGKGIFGDYNEKEWFAGSLLATEDQKALFSHDLNTKVERIQELGESIVCLVNRSEGIVVAVASFTDKIKSDSPEAIKALKEMGMKIVMITGDHHKAAQHIANQMKISQVVWEASPKEKLEHIQELQRQGYKTIFVGDGVNDAAALEAADAGIALGTGTDIAHEAGDIVLVSGSLKALVGSVRLSRLILNKIRQNLFWAFFYNIIAIPLALSGLMHPIIAEIAMSFSSLSVIGSSVLLSYRKIF